MTKPASLRPSRLLTALGLLAVLAPAALAADEDPAVDLELDLGEYAVEDTGPRTGEEFFWMVRPLEVGTSAEDVREALGEPKEIRSEAGEPGTTVQTWIYEVERSRLPADSPASRIGEVKVTMVQPLGVELGYRGAEVFVPGKYGKASRALRAALDDWKRVDSVLNLLDIAREMPRGARAADVKRFMGMPLNATQEGYGKGRTWGMTYHASDDLTVAFQIEVSPDMKGEPVGRYTGALVKVRAKDPNALRLKKSAPVDRTDW